MTQIVVKFPGGSVCDDGHGFGSEIFIVEKKKWDQLVQKVENLRKKKKKCVKSFDYSNGGHGCVIEIDFLEEFESCEILEKTPSKSVVDFVKKIHSTNFLEAFEDQLSKIVQDKSKMCDTCEQTVFMKITKICNRTYYECPKCKTGIFE